MPQPAPTDRAGRIAVPVRHLALPHPTAHSHSLLVLIWSCHCAAECTTRQNCALCYADLQGLSLRVANAGGMPPLVCRVAGETAWLEVGGLPLGIGLGATAGYGEAELVLQPGEVVVFVSNGVVEAHDGRGGLLGFERLRQIVATGPLSDAAAMIAHIGAQVGGLQGMPHSTTIVRSWCSGCPLPRC
ncbi:MAG TPA: SpoIIE family protein phosphatase [Roseiflexaceae bacterium]|nr:SpoIIE family protein phosphatase [Roseiflexaceae bacterium]